MRTSEEKDLLRPPEVARKLALSVPRIYAMAQAGILPCVRHGRAVRFRVQDVDAYIKAHRQTGPKDAA